MQWRRCQCLDPSRGGLSALDCASRPAEHAGVKLCRLGVGTVMAGELPFKGSFKHIRPQCSHLQAGRAQNGSSPHAEQQHPADPRPGWNLTCCAKSMRSSVSGLGISTPGPTARTSSLQCTVLVRYCSGTLQVHTRGVSDCQRSPMVPAGRAL